ncbi:hypothetical protein STRCI_007703 [Streptomyces cinnabarinus]|uniref:Uncharacterized protein n=1 Tax=Streptomyces cinnabarinus TaxID=67287 RepID=A0ABY7KQ57_9ACTN|nr:hypothetical protein [Streptomyces cinnabarinus]WAZ26153.1 hypothetical protein STRCI_007703 [Streptomyces cinnabarinus]
MGDVPRGRPVVVDGQELVAVSGEDFARLLATRRQVGGQSARMRALLGTVEELLRVLADVDTALAEVGAAHACAGSGCAVCTVVGGVADRVRVAREAGGRRLGRRASE